MSTVTEFDNMDELLANMASAEQNALAGLTQEQRDVLAGKYPCFASERPDVGCVIYGEFEDPLAYFADQDLTDPEVKEEYEGEREMVESSRARGYLFTKSYSVFCPHGEMGDQHVSRITRGLTREQFEAARAKWWVA